MNPEAEATALQTRAIVHVLEDQRVIRVGGDDALAWLQGQVTQDVGSLSVGQSAFTLILGSNGKVRTDAWVHRRGDDVLLVLAASSAEATLTHLDAHVIMEDVELALDPELVVVTVQGPESTALRRGRTDALDADRFEVGAGFDLAVPRAEAESIASALEASALALGGARASELGYELARIRRGIPKLGIDFGENTLPQEAGLALRAVSFGKGCYLGQEPVVMLEHRGKPPKRLFLVRARGSLETDADLTSADGQAAGRLTSIAPFPEPDGRFAGLALIKRAHATDGSTLRSGDVDIELLRPAGMPRNGDGDVS
jgi:tRNA-modifying protein YgfZ